MPIKKGQPAPYDGQVLTTDLAVKLALKADGCDARITVEVEHVRRMERLEVERLQTVAAIDKEANGERNRLLMGQIENEQAWWKQPPFVAAVSVAITLGLVWVVGESLQGIGQ